MFFILLYFLYVYINWRNLNFWLDENPKSTGFMKKWLIENKVYIYMKEKKEGHKKAKGINKL